MVRRFSLPFYKPSHLVLFLIRCFGTPHNLYMLCGPSRNPWWFLTCPGVDLSLGTAFIDDFFFPSSSRHLSALAPSLAVSGQCRSVRQSFGIHSFTVLYKASSIFPQYNSRPDLFVLVHPRVFCQLVWLKNSRPRPIFVR